MHGAELKHVFGTGFYQEAKEHIWDSDVQMPFKYFVPMLASLFAIAQPVPVIILNMLLKN